MTFGLQNWGNAVLTVYYVAGRKWFIRSDLLSTLTDEMIHETVMRFADTPVGCSE